MPEYAFDVKLFAALRVTAVDERSARAILKECLDCATIMAGHLSGEASADGEADLFEVDGEAV